MIEGYGEIHPLPDAAVQPDERLGYKLVFDITKSADPAEVNTGLSRLARLINLFASAGVASERVHLVAVVHGAATRTVFHTSAYRERFGVDNPNLPLIRALREAGVHVMVCGQSLFSDGDDRALVAPEVTIALSALVVLANYQMQGYGVMYY